MAPAAAAVSGVERFRVPELLFQPMALAGVDQAGLPELVSLAMKRLPAHVAAEVARGGVVLTGGNIMFPGKPGMTVYILPVCCSVTLE